MTPRTGTGGNNSGREGKDTGVVSMSTKMALLNLAGEDGQIPIPVPTRRSARSDGSQSARPIGNNSNNNSNSAIVISSRSTRGTPRQGVPTPRSTRDMNIIQSFPSTDSHRSLNLKTLHSSGGGIHSSGGGIHSSGGGGGGGGGGSMPSTPHHRTGTDRLDSSFVKEDEGVSQGDYLVARRAAAQQQTNKTTNNNTNNTTYNANNNEGKISARERLSNPNLHLNLNGLTSHTTGTTSTGVPTGNSLLQAKVTPRENYTATTTTNTSTSPHHLMAPSGSGTPDSRSTSSSPAGSPKSLGRFRSFLNNTFRI